MTELFARLVDLAVRVSDWVEDKLSEIEDRVWEIQEEREKKREQEES